MVPKNDLERALVSTGFDSNGVIINTSVGEDEKIGGYMELLNHIESPERLIELQLKLESDLPYFEISSDDSIRNYFSHFGVQISNKRDLRLFSYTLAQKISGLDREDEQTKPILRQLDYRRSLQNLPKSLSKLETILSDFGSLAGPFSSVLQYVLEQTGKGFRMVEDGKVATSPYSGILTIKPIGKNSAKISINLQEPSSEVRDVLEFYARKLPELGTLEILPLRVFNRDWSLNVNSQMVNPGFFKYSRYFGSPAGDYLDGKPESEKLSLVKLNEEDMIKGLVKTALESPDEYMKSLQNYFKVLFNLPKIMGNYNERMQGDFRGILDSTMGQIKED